MGAQVKTPRFYVDMPTFLHATGDLKWQGNFLYMNPSNPTTKDIDQADTSGDTVFNIGSATTGAKTSFPINFVALLNHNLGSNTNGFQIVGKDEFATSGEDLYPAADKQILNANHTEEFIEPYYNGTTIFEFASKDKYWNSFDVWYNSSNPIDAGKQQLGSFVVGKYWDAPNSPDLSLTMSRRFEGIKTKKTMGGKTLSNIYYDGPTEWTMYHREDGTYKYPPFELDLAEPVVDLDTDLGNLETHKLDRSSRVKSGLGRKGLRSWNLTFSYISEDNMWMENELSNVIKEGETVNYQNSSNPMLTDDSFNFVWNCTLGGTLPFIFQPDNTNSHPDQFSICTFNQKTLSVQQVAFNTYTLSVTIDEVA